MDSTGKNVILRRLRAADADEVGSIYALITKQPVNMDFKRLLREHADKDDDAAHFVAELDGRIVGFMISYILTLGFGIEKSAWIATMGVSPKHMGQGIGAGLAQKIFSFYKERGVTRVYTSVRWDSADLLSFFKTLGFERSNFINLKRRLSDNCEQ